MGVAWSSYKEKRKEKKELKRKRGLRSSMSPSEEAKITKMIAQMEQQIHALQALEEQIKLKKIALTISNRPQQLVRTLSSPPVNKLADQREAPDLQSKVSESDRLIVEACQFAQFMKEHPLEKWSVGSLPNLNLYW